uniref:Uncharacterized protein n=1 Tax=Ciona savignyi TaxID=51511 RepID=H2Y5F2_CIOSA
MFKFNKNEELYQVIDQQKEQIARYESRLRDLVHAYKSLQKEKDALEESMKALTAARSGVRKKRQNDRQKQESQDVLEEDKVNVNEEQALSDDASDKIEDDVEDIEHLRSQLFTLTTSISTMSEEKKRIVAVYQAEKKQLKHENEVQINKLQEENEVLVKKIELLKQELSRVKEKLRSQQSDHD